MMLAGGIVFVIVLLGFLFLRSRRKKNAVVKGDTYTLW